MRKRWIFVPVILVILALGATAGATLADGHGEDGGSRFGSFASRVAGILGLDDSTVQDAFIQASQELRDERLQTKLDRLVEQGVIAQEQADEYKEWYQSKPEGLDFGHRSHNFGGTRFFFKSRFHNFGGHGGDNAGSFHFSPSSPEFNLERSGLSFGGRLFGHRGGGRSFSFGSRSDAGVTGAPGTISY